MKRIRFDIFSVPLIIITILLPTEFLYPNAINKWEIRPKNYFGEMVSISGNFAIIGSYFTQAVYIFKREGDKWIQDEKLSLYSDGYVGSPLSVSISGNYATMGVYYETTGICNAYIFKKEEYKWVEQAKLIGSDVVGSDVKEIYFAESVSISGNYAIFGSGVYYPYQLGSVNIFKREGDKWLEQAKLIPSDADDTEWPSFGYCGLSVSISGDYAIVGSTQIVSAYIFKREDNKWVEQAKLIPSSDGDSLNSFGESVSISGDYAIVGESGGQPYIFKREGDKWIEQARLLVSDGRFVEISGDYAIVSCNHSAYIFKREGVKWVEQAKLEFDNYINDSISISENYAIIGQSQSSSGYANIYTLPIETTPPNSCDANGDGIVNLKDILTCLQSLIGLF